MVLYQYFKRIAGVKKLIVNAINGVNLNLSG